jgi:hypothetical protein
MVDRAYADIVLSGEYTYARFAQRIADVITAHTNTHHPRIQVDEKAWKRARLACTLSRWTSLTRVEPRAIAYEVLHFVGLYHHVKRRFPRLMRKG